MYASKVKLEADKSTLCAKSAKSNAKECDGKGPQCALLHTSLCRGSGPSLQKRLHVQFLGSGGFFSCPVLRPRGLIRLRGCHICPSAVKLAQYARHLHSGLLWLFPPTRIQHSLCSQPHCFATNFAILPHIPRPSRVTPRLSTLNFGIANADFANLAAYDRESEGSNCKTEMTKLW